MTRGKVDYAERLALNELDKWNDVVGLTPKHTTIYYEIQALLKDAVHIGIQMSLNGEVNRDEDGNIVKR